MRFVLTLDQERRNKAMPFKPEDHLMQLTRWTKDENGYNVQVKDDYLEVKWRLVWFRDRYPNGTIETQEMCVDLDREVTIERRKWNADKKKNEMVAVTAKGYARMKATVCTGEGGQATGTKTETAVDFPDFVEKAETGAIGRALAALGFGTQFTGGELDEGTHIVDSPVRHENPTDAPEEKSVSQMPVPVARDKEETSPASEQQLSSIRKLCQHLQKPTPDDLSMLTFFNARKVIQQLTTEYKEARQRQQTSEVKAS